MQPAPSYNKKALVFSGRISEAMKRIILSQAVAPIATLGADAAPNPTSKLLCNGSRSPPVNSDWLVKQPTKQNRFYRNLRARPCHKNASLTMKSVAQQVILNRGPISCSCADIYFNDFHSFRCIAGRGRAHIRRCSSPPGDAVSRHACSPRMRVNLTGERRRTLR